MGREREEADGTTRVERPRKVGFSCPPYPPPSSPFMERTGERKYGRAYADRARERARPMREQKL